MEELNKYCHDCGKKVNNGDFFCNDCYGKKKYNWVFNLIAFSFGFCELPIAILVLIRLKNAKLSFYKWMKYGVVTSSIAYLLIFCLRILG